MNRIKKLRLGIFLALFLVCFMMVLSYWNVVVVDGEWYYYYDSYIDAEYGSDEEYYFLEKLDELSNLSESITYIGGFIFYLIIGILISLFVWSMTFDEIIKGKINKQIQIQTKCWNCNNLFSTIINKNDPYIKCEQCNAHGIIENIDENIIVQQSKPLWKNKQQIQCTSCGYVFMTIKNNYGITYVECPQCNIEISY